MEKIRLNLTEVEKLADSAVNLLTDQAHTAKIMKKVYMVAYEMGFNKGKAETVGHIVKNLEASV